LVGVTHFGMLMPEAPDRLPAHAGDTSWYLLDAALEPGSEAAFTSRGCTGFDGGMAT
jgi:hypothetical protein